MILAFDAPSDPTDIETIQFMLTRGLPMPQTTTDGAPASVVFGISTPLTRRHGQWGSIRFRTSGDQYCDVRRCWQRIGLNPITVTPTFDGCSYSILEVEGSA